MIKKRKRSKLRKGGHARSRVAYGRSFGTLRPKLQRRGMTYLIGKLLPLDQYFLGPLGKSIVMSSTDSSSDETRTSHEMDKMRNVLGSLGTLPPLKDKRAVAMLETCKDNMRHLALSRPSVVKHLAAERSIHITDKTAMAIVDYARAIYLHQSADSAVKWLREPIATTQ